MDIAFATEHRVVKHIGKTLELWRYPVSSLGGETAETLEINQRGVTGDRHFCLFDPVTGIVAAPEKDPRWRPALFLRGESDGVGRISIIFPDGEAFHLRDAALPHLLKDHFGFDVAVGRYAHAAAEDYLPVITNRYEPASIHLVTRASVEKLAEFVTSNSVDRRRMRPTIFLLTDDPNGFVEDEWIGSTLHFGTVKARIFERTKRCGMTLIAQPELDEDPEILRSILRKNGRHLGVYCDVLEPGTLTVGESVYLSPE